MRVAVALLAGVVCLSAGHAQDAKEGKLAKRYGIEVDLEIYPQGTPKEALASVLKAIERKRIDYLLAHLADPEFVDMRVRVLGGKFEELVKETTAKLAADPTAVKELGRFLREGQWEGDDATASAQLKDVKERRVYMRKLEGRWFLENRQKPPAEK